MDVSRILAELKSELQQLDQAIVSLERLARRRAGRPGRPRMTFSEVEPELSMEPKRRGRVGESPGS